MKRFLFLLVCLLGLFVVSPVAAQGGENRIDYGQTVEGTITNAQFEHLYTFSGAGGDLIAIELLIRDFQPLPALVLLDATGAPVGSVEMDGMLRSVQPGAMATYVGSLPADGDYTIVATRFGGRMGMGEGDFVLRLIKIPTLVPEEPVLNSLTQRSRGYYSFEGPGPIQLSYEHLGGDLRPNVSVFLLQDSGDLESLISFQGERVNSFTVDVNTSRVSVERFLVVVRPPLDTVNLLQPDLTADYSVMRVK